MGLLPQLCTVKTAHGNTCHSNTVHFPAREFSMNTAVRMINCQRNGGNICHQMLIHLSLQQA